MLPFQVHSAKPLDYLGESVANLIRSRLEASGRVRVLDADRVSQRVGPDGAAGASETELRELARDLDSDFVRQREPHRAGRALQPRRAGDARRAPRSRATPWSSPPTARTSSSRG